MSVTGRAKAAGDLLPADPKTSPYSFFSDDRAWAQLERFSGIGAFKVYGSTFWTRRQGSSKV
jgi:hypothetical protein